MLLAALDGLTERGLLRLELDALGQRGGLTVRRLAAQRLWLLYLGAGVLLTVAYLTLAPLKGSGPVMNLLGLSPVVAILVGLRLHRPRSLGPVDLVRRGLPAVLVRRPLHLQLPAAARPRRPVPVARRRLLRARLPGPHGRAAAADPSPQRQPGPRRGDRRPDPHARARAAAVGHADGALRARLRAVDGGEAGLDRLPARRRAAARRGDPAGAGRRPPRAGVLPHQLEHRLLLATDFAYGLLDAARRLRPPALARRRLDRLLRAVGRRGAASVDGARSSSPRRASRCSPASGSGCSPARRSSRPPWRSCTTSSAATSTWPS